MVDEVQLAALKEVWVEMLVVVLEVRKVVVV